MPNDMRGRLIELIRKAKRNTKGANCDLEREMLFADYLLANGVVVLDTDIISPESDADCSEWISVEDVLPPPFESVLVCMPGESPLPMIHEGFISKEGVWYANHFVREGDEITHWQPMPEPPEKFKKIYTEMLEKKTDGKEVANSG